MSKRSASEYRLARKRKKDGASYASVDLDALVRRGKKVEDISVWDVSMSEKTGRITASRKNYRHVYQSPPEPLHEDPPTDIREEITAPVDPGPGELPPRLVAKHKRARVRENDSVSFMSVFSAELIITRRQTRMADWLEYRSIMLDELLRKDGLGDLPTPGTCVNCMKLVGEYRCDDCFGGNMYCSECILSSHCQLPLHRIQVRPGESYWGLSRIEILQY